jgi:hypothetical protein
MPSRGRPFQRGVSGNPGGRPKVDPEVKALLDEMTPEAIKTLGEIMRNKKAQASARATAALGILRKTVPDLSSQELKAEIGSHVVRLPMVAPTVEAWLESIKPQTRERPLLKALDATQQPDPSEPNG